MTTRGLGRLLAASLLSLVLTLAAQRARAAGFDTPILYTARHQAMGGTAISYVDDPSAGFHNPAGLRGVQGLALIGDISLLLGKVQASPDLGATSAESELVIAPFFLIGAGYRVHEWVSLGLGVFPVASGGARYEYELAGNAFVDSTNIVFFEATPFASLNIPDDELVPGALSFGAGYRASLLQFTREKGDPDDPRVLNLDMSGTNFAGFRIGAQYRPIAEFGVGIVYRSRIEITTKADRADVFVMPATDAELPFVLPAKLGSGIDVKLERLRLALDAEYAFQSQNERVALSGTLNGSEASVPNVFEWQDGVTLRVGAEYRLGDPGAEVPLRVGYIFDSTVVNQAYPTAFGTPPAPTQTITAGGGYDAGRWELNGALTHRFGSTEVAAEELGSDCSFCGFAGEYAITMTGFYLDASVDFDL
jgi:long-chain fatty acid transport protein